MNLLLNFVAQIAPFYTTVVAPLQCGNIVEMTSQQLKAEMAISRKYLIVIIETLQYFARQGIPMQGKSDPESDFMRLLYLWAKDIDGLEEWLNKKTNRYTSHDIQNEILASMATHVLKNIVADITDGQCNLFSLIADEYTDVANFEQLSICLRWIDDNLNSHEDFLGFY